MEKGGGARNEMLKIAKWREDRLEVTDLANWRNLNFTFFFFLNLNSKMTAGNSRPTWIMQQNPQKSQAPWALSTSGSVQKGEKPNWKGWLGNQVLLQILSSPYIAGWLPTWEEVWKFLSEKSSGRKLLC